MRKGARILLLLAVVGVGAVIGTRLWRGSSGASKPYGGSLEASVLPDFPDLSPARWVNGAPTGLSSARGSVVLIEAWHPA